MVIPAIPALKKTTCKCSETFSHQANAFSNSILGEGGTWKAVLRHSEECNNIGEAAQQVRTSDF